MKFLANENFPKTSFLILKQANWDIEHIGITHSSISDHEVMDIAVAEDRIILTFDSDFGELVYQLGYTPSGVIFFRIKDFTPDDPATLLIDLVRDPSIVLAGKFTVIDDDRIRQRNIP